MAAPIQPPNGTRKSVNGLITKLVGDGGTFGFINDEIFFQQDVVVGGPVAINDRVFAECEYSENLPIKWNAISIKIVQKANGPPTGPHMSVASAAAPPSLLESDPRRRQGILGNAQQQTFNQPLHQQQQQPVANTYQQHRQQRQQQQQQRIHEPQPFETTNQTVTDSINQDRQTLGNFPTIPPSGQDFYSPFAGPVSQPHDIMPFQQQQQQQQIHDTPMGPPKLTYTSQLGAAFVQSQNPVVPPPFMQQQTNTCPQSMLPSNQQQGMQRNKPSRFNQVNQVNNKNQDNSRQMDNRTNRGRNDGNRSDHHQSRDSRSSQNDRRNQSSRSDAPSRDRSGNRSPKRDRSSRSSPPSHHPIRSRTSVSSERSGIHSNSKSSTRRHYESQNIPKTRILTNMNCWNMKSRCPSSIHVPSDLKDVIVNQYFRLDVKNIPKPIKYKIEPHDARPPNADSIDENSATKKESIENTQKLDTHLIKESEQSETEAECTNNQDNSNTPLNSLETSLITPPSQPKLDIKMNHKYGVKVVLISLPEMETIYKNVFGSNLDSYSSESNGTKSRLDESIALLCNKGQNCGHSLIGGKFDPSVDGFVEGEHNEFERHGRQPDLIATCRRIVLEQTGLDLSTCQSWSLLSTFIYNHRSDYFSPKASIEYSYIYMPQIWTMVPKIENEEQNVENEVIKNESQGGTSEQSLLTSEVEDAIETTDDITDVSKDETTGVDPPAEPRECQAATDVTSTATECGLKRQNLSDLKVVDLKLELDKRSIKYKPNAKKADLVALLQETLVASKETVIESSSTEASHDTAKTGDTDTTSNTQTQSLNADQALEPIEGVASLDESTDTNHGTQDAVTSNTIEPGELLEAEDGRPREADTEGLTVGNKRKSSDDGEQADVCSGSNESVKKSRVEDQDQVSEDLNKKKKVELIRDPFVVRSRDEQQQLTAASLFDIVQISRYDQFELSVVSNLLKESLIQHLSEYILTTLIENHRAKNFSEPSDSSASISSGSQDTISSDTNNNNSSINGKRQTNQQAQDSVDDGKTATKEYPVDRYINLAFSYFDTTHIGCIHADDLSKLFNNTGFTISKRALISLIGENEKFNYKTLPDLSPKLAPSYVYNFPDQFTRLPGRPASESGSTVPVSKGRTVEYQGVRHNVESLIEQARSFELMRVNMIERYNHAIESFDKQSEEIHVLEVNQRSLTTAIKTQNDEIVELKRERDSLKKKLDTLRKGIKSSIGSLNELLTKDDK